MSNGEAFFLGFLFGGGDKRSGGGCLSVLLLFSVIIAGITLALSQICIYAYLIFKIFMTIVK